MLIIATFVALLLADYNVVIHHIFKPPERQKTKNFKLLIIRLVCEAIYVNSFFKIKRELRAIKPVMQYK